MSQYEKHTAMEKFKPWSVFAIFAYAGSVNNEHIVIVEKEKNIDHSSSFTSFPHVLKR